MRTPMYLARQRTKGITRYIIRQSFPFSGHFRFRDLFDLGTDPKRFIQYPGGRGYYYDPCIEEALSKKGVELAPDDLDRIFFQFLDPEIQRVITGFDRSHRNKSVPDPGVEQPYPVHIFDKRRYHYLRFGHSQQRNIDKIPDKIFRPLRSKSRDELEHYFESEERKLKLHEKGPYVMTIFQIIPSLHMAGQYPVSRMDKEFIGRLCQLNNDELFLAGVPKHSGLFEHLIRYAILYFDFTPIHQAAGLEYIKDFINRHRIHRPPDSIQIKIKEAEKLFEHDWRTLKRMERAALTRLYRQKALKHHPDQGGDTETFHRLSQYYEALIEKKPKR
ncbi:MAG: hypothetical protein PVJ19_00055 [Desulfobacteraceae bacterium]